MKTPSAFLSVFVFASGLLAAEAPGLTAPPAVPREHPRLYLRGAEVARLPARLNHPVLAPVAARLERMARKSPQFSAEWRALQYLLQPDATAGRTLVADTLRLLQASELPDKQDACRVTGRMMVTGAIVYDWLYPVLTPADRAAFIKELVRLAKTQECGYPPARNWFYPGGAYHQGDSYGLHRYSWDLFPLFIFDRMGAGNVYHPAQQFVPYSWVYTTRPDGQRLRAGDTFAAGAPPGQPWNEYGGTMLTASYYHDGVLLSQALQQGAFSDNEALFELLWRDPDLKPQPIADLPLSRYFGSPFGWMVARTGWGEDAVIAEMKINEYNFANHQHLDAGAFQLYARGALAIDSGLYQGGSSGAYGSPHGKNYYWRTIAHNALLIHDPAEKFSPKGDYGNDGGQRLPNGRSEPRTLADLLAAEKGYRTGRVLAHGFGPDAQKPAYTLLQGDLTAAYSGKVKAVQRSFVFLNLGDARVPAALIVFDRVVSTDPAFRKYWLLHTLEEPRLQGARATVDRIERGARGRLELDVLLPAADNAANTVIGGPGREYWVFGRNFANDVDPARRARSTLETGDWRIEVSPQRAAAEDHFLTVMQTTDRTAPGRLPVHRLDAGAWVGCTLGTPTATWVVLSRRDQARSEQPVTFTLPAGPGGRMLVTHLAPGRWRAVPAAGPAQFLTVTATAGAAWWEGPPGPWTLTRE